MDALQPRRRDVLRQAVGLVGGAGALSALAACEGDPPVPSTRAAGVLNPSRRARLESLADAIIPRTDTPGALDVGVPDFIEDMMRNWASGATRLRFGRVLDDMELRARERSGTPMVRMTPEARAEHVAWFDRDAFSRGDRGYQELKELIMLGYYYSEPGATEELQYEHVPGRWIACAPLAEIGRTWAD